MNIQQLTTQINDLLLDNTTRQISEADVRTVLSAMLLQTGEEVESNVVVGGKVQIDLSNPRGANYTTAFAGEFEFVNAQPGGVARFTHADVTAFADPASTTIFGSYEDNVSNYCEVICVDASPATYQMWIRQPGAFSGGPAGDTSRIQDADNDTFVEVEGAADNDTVVISSEGRSVGLIEATRQRLGDHSDVGNGVYVDINDSTQQILLNSAQAMLGGGGPSRAQIQLLGSILFVMNERVVGSFSETEQWIGDQAGAGNSTRIRINDGSQFIQFYAQDLILEGYPSTRDDGPTTKALYVDANGHIKYGTVSVVGSGSQVQSVITDASYDVLAADEGKLLIMNSASAQVVNFPDGLPANFQVDIVKIGAGNVQITADTTFTGTNNGDELTVINSGATVYHTGSNVFVGVGALFISNVAPTATPVSWSGTAQVGQTLTLSFVFGDTEGDLQNITAGGTQYEISRHDTQIAADNNTGGTVIESGDTLHDSQVQYTPVVADETKFLSGRIIPKALTGTIQGLEAHASLTGAIAAASAATYPTTDILWRLHFPNEANVTVESVHQGVPAVDDIADEVTGKIFTNAIDAQHLLYKDSAHANGHKVATGNVAENAELRATHDAATNIPAGSAFSIGGCVRITSLADREIFLFKGVSATSAIQFMPEKQSDDSFRFTWNGTTLAVNHAGFWVAGDLNTETTFMLTYDNVNFRLYKNKVLVATIADASGIDADITNNTWIGGSNTANINETTELAGAAIHLSALNQTDVDAAHDYWMAETGN